MKNLFLAFTTLIVLISCQEAVTGPTEAQKDIFKKNYTSFLDHHVKGF